jgi:hypothetical protein
MLRDVGIQIGGGMLGSVGFKYALPCNSTFLSSVREVFARA